MVGKRAGELGAVEPKSGAHAFVENSVTAKVVQATAQAERDATSWM